MQKKRYPSLSALALSMCCAAGPASALGFGASTPSAWLGQPLDFEVALRLEPGEAVEPGCVGAEVAIGDRRLPAETVVARYIEASGRVRVQTRIRVDEPVVSVNLSVGCAAPLARQFVVFADPPPFIEAQAETRPAASPAAAPVAVPASAVAQNTPAPPPSAAPAPPRPRPATEAPRNNTQAAARPARRTPRPAPAPRPRLRLDAAPPLPAAAATLSPEAMAIIDQANEAVKAAIAAASASQGRMAALEATVQQLRADAAAQRELMQRMNDRSAEAASRTGWVLPLLVATIALLALSAWLWLRLREIERDRRQAWLEASRRAASASPDMPPPPASQVPLLVERRLRDRPDPTRDERRNARPAAAGSPGAGLAPVHEPSPSEWPHDPEATHPGGARGTAPAPRPEMPPVPPVPPMATEPPSQRTQPLVPLAGGAAEVRDVSAEELIDLEQQAEFFVVLGQDDAAIDLLVAHLRDAGGASPVPYLKLLEIYRRQGDEAVYERTRERFNHRFNARAPAWDEPALQGRSLEDYPSVIGWLQRVWPRPIDAMAELEALLFRRDGGELFELPAYREVLLLYATARELVDAEPAAGGAAVDVLLPLSDVARPAVSAAAARAPEADPTAPVDLDLTDPPAEPPISRLGGFL